MEPLTMMAIMAAAGLAKNQFIDKPKEDKLRKAAAAQTANSYWSKLGAGQSPQEKDGVGEALSWAGTGAQFAQAHNNYEFDQKMQERMAKDPNGHRYWSRMRGGI